MKWNGKNDTYNESLINEADLLLLGSVSKKLVQRNYVFSQLLLKSEGIAVVLSISQDWVPSLILPELRKQNSWHL